MSKFKSIFTNWRVILLISFLILSLWTIQPQIFGNDGVIIKSVVTNSSASLAGIENPSPKLMPLAKEKIISIDRENIVTLEDYYNAINLLQPNKTVRIQTNKEIYTLKVEFNNGNNVDLGLKIAEAPKSNLRKGLDLAGGTRVLLKPQEEISATDLETTVDSLKERLNIYGLSDIVVRAASDLSGQDYILIEIAGVTEEEVKELLSKQGKFEASIANETVFFGGKKDITYVCRSAECSGIDPNQGCVNTNNGYTCRFFFGITLSPEAARRSADITGKLAVEMGNDGQSYLSEDLILFLDDKEVDSLKIGSGLKGRVTTDIQISGSGVGRTQSEALNIALQNMKKLQTIIITGSLPVKLNVVKMDTISPSLGQEFLSNLLFVGLLVILSVSMVIFIRYRKFKIAIPIFLTLVSEVIFILWFAVVFKWQLGLAAIAGIIIVMGTGVDHLIIITDETLKGEQITDWKRKIKNAMSVVIVAALTTFAGMIPLIWAGAGQFRGFAFTTMAGISFGVLVARPAYAVIINKLLND